MNEAQIRQLGDELHAALRSARTLAPLSERHPALTIEEAYRISLRFLQRRQEEGEQVIGKKIGVTSQAVQEMLDVHQPDFGFLTDRMHYPDGATLKWAETGLIQPRAEGEIAFMLKDDLTGDRIRREDVLEASQWLAPCFEIVDSRIRDWKIRIQDTVADNASCGVFVLGQQKTPPRQLDLAAVHMTMSRNGETVGSGYGSAVQGHPAQAVAWLANTLSRFGIAFRKGELILSGALAPLIPARAGDRFFMEISGMGSCSVNFARTPGDSAP